jgi:hypothetical protein
MRLHLRVPWPGAPNSYTVLTEDGERCGSLRLAPGASWDVDVWRWSIMELNAGRVNGNGTALTREAALEAFADARERY